MSRPLVYYSCPISGAKGAEGATSEYIARNCMIAKKNIEVLQIIEPRIEWFSVAPGDMAVARLYHHGYITIDQIMEIDFEILDRCDGVLAHVWESSEGAKAEYNRQIDLNEGVALWLEGPSQIWKCNWDRIDDFVDKVLWETADKMDDEDFVSSQHRLFL